MLVMGNILNGTSNVKKKKNLENAITKNRGI